MATNFDLYPWVATRGQRVRLNCFNVDLHPKEWENVGIVTGITLDRVLTSMNKKNVNVYRISVDVGHDEVASVLPYILKRA